MGAYSESVMRLPEPDSDGEDHDHSHFHAGSNRSSDSEDDRTSNLNTHNHFSRRPHARPQQLEFSIRRRPHRNGEPPRCRRVVNRRGEAPRITSNNPPKTHGVVSTTSPHPSPAKFPKNREYTCSLSNASNDSVNSKDDGAPRRSDCTHSRNWSKTGPARPRPCHRSH